MSVPNVSVWLFLLFRVSLLLLLSCYSKNNTNILQYFSPGAPGRVSRFWLPFGPWGMGVTARTSIFHSTRSCQIAPQSGCNNLYICQQQIMGFPISSHPSQQCFKLLSSLGASGVFNCCNNFISP